MAQNTVQQSVIGKVHISDVCKLSLLERLPPPINKLLNIDREVNVITDSVPAQLLLLPHQVVSHVAQQQHTPLMESPLGHFSTESFVARFCITAQHLQMLLGCTAVTKASCLGLWWLAQAITQAVTSVLPEVIGEG